MGVSLKSILGKLFANGKEVALVDDGSGIESGGTSENGYIKYPDGTLIVKRVSIELSSPGQQVGSVYYVDHSGVEFSGSIAGNPPAFIEPPYCIYSTVHSAQPCWATSSPTKTTVTTAYPRILCSATGGKAYAAVIAIGRWK